MKSFPCSVLPALFAVILTGCASSEFSKDLAKSVLEANPVQLNGEQLLLNEEQVRCGDREDLWHLTQVDGGHTIGRLSEKGRELQFSDDVRIGYSGAEGATVQVSGKFSLQVARIPSFQDEGERSKVVEARTSVVVNHKCFKRPLPVLMGIQHGEFSANANPLFRLRLRENWGVEELLHQ